MWVNKLLEGEREGHTWQWILGGFTHTSLQGQCAHPPAVGVLVLRLKAASLRGTAPPEVKPLLGEVIHDWLMQGYKRTLGRTPKCPARSRACVGSAESAAATTAGIRFASSPILLSSLPHKCTSQEHSLTNLRATLHLRTFSGEP